MIEITYVILCGGFDALLTPISRSGFPKQFLCLSKAELGEDDIVRFENTYGRQ